MSKTTKTPLRSLQSPLRHLDGALENTGVWPLSRRAETWKLICSFLEVSLRHPPCQKPPRLLSGASTVLLDSKDDTWMTVWGTRITFKEGRVKVQKVRSTKSTKYKKYKKLKRQGKKGKKYGGTASNLAAKHPVWERSDQTPSGGARIRARSDLKF